MNEDKGSGGEVGHKHVVQDVAAPPSARGLGRDGLPASPETDGLVIW